VQAMTLPISKKKTVVAMRMCLPRTNGHPNEKW